MLLKLLEGHLLIMNLAAKSEGLVPAGSPKPGSRWFTET